MVNRKMGDEPVVSSKDITELLIEFRNMLNRLSTLPSKEEIIRLSTRDKTYTGRIKSINIAERRVILLIEDGTTLIVPFHSLMMPEKPDSS